MAGRQLIFDLSAIDLNHVVADIEEIRKYNPQRFEMEQLTAIVYEDTSRHLCVGYKEITREEFWVRGHMPNMPLMPGVIILEAAAQMCSYYGHKHDLAGAPTVGFGGLDDVRFRDPVIPGDRLYLVSELIRVRRGRMLISRFQGIVGESVVAEGTLKGVAISDDMIKKSNPDDR
ncbi:MAG: 3-hydroxyacyl-ACP dehydratase FabZ family protein [Pirellulaceae bacterium]